MSPIRRWPSTAIGSSSWPTAPSRRYLPAGGVGCRSRPSIACASACIRPVWRRASRICDHVVARLFHQVEVSADPILIALYEELRNYPMPEPDRSAIDHPGHREAYGDVVVPFRLRTNRGVMSF